jgi:hypothetical protein
MKMAARTEAANILQIMKELLSGVGGAGSFAALVPIYRSGNDIVAGGVAPTMAANIAIELGWPALCASVLLMAVVCVVLLRGSLARGRDSFYATAAAGCAVLVTAEAFVDASLAGAAVSIIVTSIVGLGVAQSVSRSLQ